MSEPGFLYEKGQCRLKITGGIKMGKIVRARFSRGVIKPLEKLDLEEGKEIAISIVEFPSKRKREAFRRSAGAWKGTIDAEKLIENIYADRLLSTREEPKL